MSAASKKAGPVAAAQRLAPGDGERAARPAGRERAKRTQSAKSAKSASSQVQQVQHYAAQFEQWERTLGAARQPERLRVLRRAAIERFAELGFPSLRDEEWRFTNVAPVARTAYRLAERGKVAPAAAARHLYPGCRSLVFHNGHFLAELSQPAEPANGDGLVATSLVRLEQRSPEHHGLDHLASHAAFERQSFVALNTALFADGALVLIPDGAVLSEPLQLLFLHSPAEGGARVSYPRVLVVAGANSQATIVESYVGLGGSEGSAALGDNQESAALGDNQESAALGDNQESAALGDGHYLTCAVTEVVGGQGSVLEHYRVQKEALSGAHLATLQISLDRAASFRSHSIAHGGGLVRLDTNAILDGEGIDCILNGLYVLSGQQHTDNHMRVEHKQPRCSSHELFKGILDERSRAVFSGRIYVHPGAQKTDAKQTNRNLLLSREAMVNSNPQLEIFADDVRCTHGSTVGELDADALFYLRSRGIDVAAARSLLTYAFASEIVEKIKLAELRSDLNEFLFSRLAGGEIVRHAI